MHQISTGIFCEDSYLGVTLGGLVFPHGIIFVDAPLRMEDARTWRSMMISQRGGNRRLLVNLDSHPDRTLGARQLDCTVVAHQKTGQVYRNRPSIFKGHAVETGAAWEVYPEAIGMRWYAPDITFTQTMTLHWGEPEVILEHHPGPTAGACWLIMPSERVIFLGDSVLVGQPPFLANAELFEWIINLKLIEDTYKDYVLVAGRGGVASMEQVRLLRQGLTKTQRSLERLSKRHAPPEATESLIPSLMDDFAVPANDQPRYVQRLRYGLYQYYARRLRSTTTVEDLRSEENGS
jgi:glyoxylase-like metal-dependent hydrolase (beta-lactamase superfamily II)